MRRQLAGSLSARFGLKSVALQRSRSAPYPQDVAAHEMVDQGQPEQWHVANGETPIAGILPPDEVERRDRPIKER